MNYDKLRKEEYDHGYKVGYVKGYTDGKADRPHGEWKHMTVCGVEFINCSNCGCGCPSYSYVKKGETEEKVQHCETEFCPNCGAIMCESLKNAPIYERPMDEWLKAVIEDLESRKSYGVEYSQAMEDVIVILKARLGIVDEVEND